MHWLHYISYFFAGAFLVNGVPHLVHGVTGRAFQSPFAKPPGRGLSSATVNFVWGWANLIAGYILVCQVGRFDLQSISQVIALALGGLLAGLLLARHFGRFHGGNDPENS